MLDAPLQRMRANVTKWIGGVCGAVLLVGCATTRSGVDGGPLVERVEYLGAHDALAQNGRRLPPSVYSLTIDSATDLHVQVFPMSYAIECGAEMTDCQHAVVSTEVKLHAVRDDDKTVQVRGLLKSAMGRSQTTTFGTGSARVVSRMAVPESVDVIEERARNMPFDRRVRLGEPFDIEGLAGVKVRVSYHEPAEPYGGLGDAGLMPTLGISKSD